MAVAWHVRLIILAKAQKDELSPARSRRGLFHWPPGQSKARLMAVSGADEFFFPSCRKGLSTRFEMGLVT
jgi:hypothetical protein